MAETTEIAWADSTFNPWIGCTKVSPGCDGCYAEVSTPVRIMRAKGVEPWGPHGQRQRTSVHNWRQPVAWNAGADAFEREHGRRRRVFCASLADVFDNAVDPQWRADLFGLIEKTPNLDWLLTTKRIGNVRAMVPAAWLEPAAWPKNVRIIITVVNQDEADRDIAKLLALACPNGLSMEPLLGSVDLGLQCENWSDDIVMDPETGAYECCKACDFTGIGNAIDWVICGGESGPKARPMHPDWARQLKRQCEAANVAFFMKQMGGARDKRGALEDLPDDLRVRETPHAA